METDVEGSDDDTQDQNKHSLLWQKCIQQSIFVDLSEDESLNLSDLERSLVLRVSQAESAASVPSVRLSAEPADLSDVTSSESSVNSQSDKVVEVKQPSPQHPNRRWSFDNSGQNTSDEEQEELPYDGDLGTNCSQSFLSKISTDGKESVYASPDGPGLFEPDTGNKEDVAGALVSVEQTPEEKATSATADTKKKKKKKQESVFVASQQNDLSPPCPGPADIHQLLLRHFPQEELLQADRLIQAETLPEVSLLESMDDTGCSLVSSLDSASDSAVPKAEEKNLGSEGNGDSKTAVTSSTTESLTSRSEGSKDSSVVNVSKQEKAEEDQRIPRVPLVRRRSIGDMKYGQGQVHYPLPDFSKVSPKVKIPKVPSGAARPAPQSVGAMHRTRSSPEILEVISRVLEDSVQIPENLQAVTDAARTPPKPANHLQEKPSSEVVYHEGAAGGDPQGSSTTVEEHRFESFARHLPTSGDRCPDGNAVGRASTPCRRPEEAPSDGERMTAELRDIVRQFTQKVDGFKQSVSRMSVSATEQQAMLRRILEAQDQLERRYISKKEEHRALERQNYMGLSRNTGTFDPNRHVEGDIFRMGMRLEDVKEMIDGNAREQMQISPPRSSSTPTSVKDLLEAEPPSRSTPLPQPSESLSADFALLQHKMETWEEGQNKIAQEVTRNVTLQTSSELITSDPSLRGSPCSGSVSRCFHLSVQEEDIQTAERDEEEMSSALSEALDHSNILEYLSRAKLSSRQSQPESCGTSVAVLDVCDAEAEVSSSSDAAICSLPKSPVNASSFTPQIVRAETDSGFGSSYLNPTGSLQPNLLAGRAQPQNDVLSHTDSEGSNGSNVQTVQSVVTTRQGWDGPKQPAAAVGVEQWVENTTHFSSLRLQEQTRAKCRPLAQLHHHTSDPTLSTTADAVERGSPAHSCSCNGEAILALQSEVSRLREELQECLVQLPHLAQEMEYLTSARERRSKSRSRSRSQPRRTYNSSSQVMVNGWISADTDHSKYTGTKSIDSTGSGNMQQYTKLSVGGRKTPEFKEGPKTFNLNLNFKSKSGVPSSLAKQGSQSSIIGTFYSKERWPLFSSAYLQKPLLQVSYGSSSSLPASYKVREPSALQSTPHHRKRSTQSDTALLPSEVHFQRTPSPVSVASRTRSKLGKSRGSKEEDIILSLDMAIQLACKMKQTTNNMAKRLSADLSKSRLYRKPLNIQPPGGTKDRLL